MFLGQEVHHYMVNIEDYTELDCKFAIPRENDAFVAKIVNTRLMKICTANCALAERLPFSATLGASTHSTKVGNSSVA